MISFQEWLLNLCEANFANQEKVREVIRLASEQLLSSRQIAKIVGLSKPTVFKIVKTLPQEIKNKIQAAEKERLSERSKKIMAKLHQDPEFAAARDERSRKQMAKLHQDPEFAAANAARAREIITKVNQNPEFAAARDERAKEHMTKLHQNPEFAAARDERAKEIMTRFNKDPEFVNKVKEGQKRFWQSQGGFWNWLLKFPEEKAIAILGAMTMRERGEMNHSKYYALINKYYELRS